MRTSALLCCLLLMAGALLAPALGWAQFNPQPDAITRKYFPDPELNIQTPAFAKADEFTNYQEMMAWIEPLVQQHSKLVKLSYIGQSQKGKQIPMLVLTQPNGRPKIRVWMQGGLHGDEPAGTETMLYLLQQLLTDPKLTYLLDELEIGIVPMANIDGYEKQQRESANGIDLNRDQTRLKAPETIALKQAFSAFGPAVALDFHEYRPFRKDFSRLGMAGITSRYDAMFLYSGNLNVPAALRAYTADRFVTPAKAVLNAEQLCNHDYVTTQKYGGQVQFNMGSVHARSSATSYALTNAVSTLLEIRGVGIGRTSFKRRIKTSYLIALSYLESAYKDRQHLRAVLAEAAKAKQPVVVLSKRKTYKDSIDVIDLATNNAIKMPFVLHNALQSSPTLERQRPMAYLIGTSATTAIQNLRLLGLQIDSLVSDQTLEVQVYRLGKQPEMSTEDNKPGDDEEATTGPSEANTLTVNKAFPKGTYIIYEDQPRFNLAAEVLEPENPNGFVALKVIKLSADTELPIYRYLKPERISP